MNKIFFKKKEFIEFLPKNGVKSIDSYINYVENADKYFRNRLFEIIENIYNAKSLDALDELREIGEELFEIIESASKTHYRAGFIKYLDFIEKEIALSEKITHISIPFGNIEEINPKVEVDNTDGSIYYDYKKVRRTLYGRLTTQSRYNNNGKIIFPIRFIRLVFSRKGKDEIFRNIIKKQIDDIIYFVDSIPKKIKDVKELKILKNGSVFINQEKVNTKTDLGELVELKVDRKDNLREIVIDHIQPISSILESLDKEEYPQFTLITDEFRKRANGNLSDDQISLLSSLIANDDNFINKIDFKEFEKEFEKINAKVELQLMHSTYNSKKGAK
ncbi:hypothetical protein [Capnocytophaga gingivalis]|uniref:hypothetical protein n=1 Tax=Capnocytophaga gingivalis TaxID=1017 RepID=UPI0028EF7AA3|nr:hypothetical protein [Capnocytophaga gingivalis]